MNPQCPLWAINGLMHCSKQATSFDNLVGPQPAVPVKGH